MSKQLEYQSQRKVLAEQLLSNSLYIEAFTAIRADILDKFSKTKFKESAERDELWRKMQTVDSIQSYFEQVIRNGKVAESKLDQLKTKLKQVI